MNEQTKTRGFGSMSPDRVQQIASAGGKAAHAKGTAHTWTPETAAEAGRRGGEARARNRAARLAQNAALAQKNAQVQG